MLSAGLMCDVELEAGPRPATDEDGRGMIPEPSTRKRRLTLSPKRLAQLKLHGQYIGLIRNLEPAQKAKVKAVNAKKGIREAIAMAKRLAG